MSPHPERPDVALFSLFVDADDVRQGTAADATSAAVLLDEPCHCHCDNNRSDKNTFQDRVIAAVRATRLPPPLPSFAVQLTDDELVEIHDTAGFDSIGNNDALQLITQARLNGVELPPALADTLATTFGPFDAGVVRTILQAVNKTDPLDAVGLIQAVEFFTGWDAETVTDIVTHLLLAALATDPDVALADLLAAVLSDVDESEATNSKQIAGAGSFDDEPPPPPRIRDVSALIAAARPGPHTGVTSVVPAYTS